MPRVTTPERFWAFVDRNPPGSPVSCWEWRGRMNAKGYGCIGFERRQQKAHRVAWILTHGAIPSGLSVCHVCDNPPCVNPAHLFLGTQIENIADRHAKGRTVDPPSRRKLSDHDVVLMREAWASGEVTQGQLAQRFGVSRGNVSKIVNARSYVSAA